MIAGRPVRAMTCAIVKVLPEPVTPSSTWSRSPRSSPSHHSSIACGWSPAGANSELSRNGFSISPGGRSATSNGSMGTKIGQDGPRCQTGANRPILLPTDRDKLLRRLGEPARRGGLPVMIKALSTIVAAVALSAAVAAAVIRGAGPSTTELDVEIASTKTEIAAADAQAALYSDGFILAQVQLRAVILKNTLVMMEQKRASFL